MSCGSPKCRAEGGFTLLEILIAAGLMLLASGLLISVLLPALRSGRFSTVRSEVQQQGMILLDRLASDLQSTTPAGLTLPSGDPGAGALAIHPTVGVSPDGRQPLFDRQAVVYTWGSEGDVIRLLWPRQPTDPSALRIDAPSPPSSEELERILSQPVGTERRLARDVVALEIKPSGPGGTTQPLSLHLVLEKRIEEDRRTVRLELDRSVFLRNP